jgi:hypothetical protein
MCCWIVSPGVANKIYAGSVYRRDNINDNNDTTLSVVPFASALKVATATTSTTTTTTTSGDGGYGLGTVWVRLFISGTRSVYIMIYRVYG